MNRSRPEFETLNEAFSCRRSPYFHAGFEAESIDPKTCLSEEAQFTQSNARVLVGMTPGGKLRFLSLPTRIFPLPTIHFESTAAISYGSGMYMQTDMAIYLGMMCYRIFDENGTEITWRTSCDTAYAMDFLPSARWHHNQLSGGVCAFAPVSDSPQSCALAPAPLPGPAGALYVMTITNHSDKTFVGSVQLDVGDLLTDHYDFRSFPAKKPIPPSHTHIRQETLFFTKVEGCVGIHMENGVWISWEKEFCCERKIVLTPGETLTIETQIAISEHYQDTMPEIYQLCMHDALSWLKMTAAFWQERLGNLTLHTSAYPDMAEKLRDVSVRCVIDNFNCLQVSKTGELMAHWQGAPAHYCGTIWGIDWEPTIASVMQVCPDLALQALIFFMDKSMPKRYVYEDHSIPILVAPLLLLGRYLEMTGDEGVIERFPEIAKHADNIWKKACDFLHPEAYLFASRYSSDGKVNRRYDLGTNYRMVYVCNAYARILTLEGRYAEAEAASALAEKVRSNIQTHISIQGPFGFMRAGGTNLNENQDGFYLPEGFPYVDGEDSATALGKVYGATNNSDDGWLNYLRFARSLFLTNFDPEFGAVRWYPWGRMIDGTAYFARLGGSRTIEEAYEALHILLENDVEESGSVFWWPQGKNLRRKVTRCSQGQGSWAWQFLDEWLGLQPDAQADAIQLSPNHFIEEIKWTNGYLAGCRFDYHYRRQADQATIQFCNKGMRPLRVRFPQAASDVLQPGESITRTIPVFTASTNGIDTVARVENQLLSENGVIFGTYNICPVCQLSTDGHPLILVATVLRNTHAEQMKNVCVTLRLPKGWKAAVKPQMYWEVPDRRNEGKAAVEVESLMPGEQIIAAFWVEPPVDFDETRRDYSTHVVQYDRHMFDPYHPGNQNEITLFIPNKEEIEKAEEAWLQVWNDNAAKPIRSIRLNLVLCKTANTSGLFGDAVRVTEAPREDGTSILNER